MFFYRIAGALILSFSGFGAAFMINSRLSRTLRQTEGLIALLRFIRSQVECFALPAARIIAVCDDELLRSCGFEGGEPPSDFCALFESFSISDAEVAHLMRGFSASFGRCYREEQIKECDYYIDLLRDRRERLAETIPSKKKVNSTLCVSSAIALIILLF
ncbi:MAG: stage III sporulation protein AB [Clostridia bacterium]|nr:stage III sporulation protein AB [Clostridia bacterium]